MLLLLLVSTQVLIPKMEVFNSNQDLISSESQKKKSNFSSNNDSILCNHCRRTATNGIRCLGMCVADNDY